jgi:hypothetical protein
MALSIVLFVPGGIVMASDGLVEVRNLASDHEFLHKKQKTIYKSPLGYMVCAPCPTFIAGIPIAYHFEKAIAHIKECQSTQNFAEQLSEELKKNNIPLENILFYVSGYTDDSQQEVFMADRERIFKVNEGANKEIVYNYHSVGRTVWMEKILFQTSCQFNDENIDFMPADIDFSKYSLAEAVDFACFFIYTSRMIDQFAQLNQSIGEFITIGTHELDGNINIYSMNTK